MKREDLTPNNEGAKVMTSKEQADTGRPGKETSDMSQADESKEKKPNVPFRLGSVTEEKEDLTGRAYQYFHTLQ
jgi:hypothetical protein